MNRKYTATKIPFMFVSDLYIPRIGPHTSCSRIDRSILGIYKSLSYKHFAAVKQVKKIESVS
jgi:hypothetical protein